MSDTASEHSLIPSERVRGAPVFSANGDKVGRIEELAIDKLTGTVAYAILGTTSGLFGGDERYRRLAWSDLTYDEDRGGFVVPHSAAEIDALSDLDASDLSGWRTIKKAALI